jgi:hypothetical protein
MKRADWFVTLGIALFIFGLIFTAVDLQSTHRAKAAAETADIQRDINKSRKHIEELERDTAEINRKMSVKISNFRWRKDGFGNIMIADFTIKNDGDQPAKDFEIVCKHFAHSGTEIDSNTRTLYETVAPHGTRTFREVNMGFINSQTAQSGCHTEDFVTEAK